MKHCALQHLYRQEGKNRRDVLKSLITILDLRYYIGSQAQIIAFIRALFSEKDNGRTSHLLKVNLIWMFVSTIQLQTRRYVDKGDENFRQTRIHKIGKKGSRYLQTNRFVLNYFHNKHFGISKIY
jgi:hypothetical protein